MRRLTLIALAVGAIVLLAACSNSSGDLTGKVWQLTAITEKTPAYQGVVPAADQSKYTITFNTDGTFNAEADCNAVAGTYKTSGSNLTITLGPSTLVACPEGSLRRPVRPCPRRCGELHDRQRRAHDHAQGRRLAERSRSALTPSPSAARPAPPPTPTASTPPDAKPTAAADGQADRQPDGRAVDAPTRPPRPSRRRPPRPRHRPGADAGAQPRHRPHGSLAADGDHREGPGLPGRRPGGRAGQLHRSSSRRTARSRRRPTATRSRAIHHDRGGRPDAHPGPSTIVACAEGSLSDLYVLGLSNAASYAIANNQLTITLADEGTLVYK